jgi:hypothetical protein
VEDLHVNNKLAAVVIDDQDPDAATTSLKGFGETGPKVGLIDDRERLLHIASLGHGDDYEKRQYIET